MSGPRLLIIGCCCCCVMGQLLGMGAGVPSSSSSSCVRAAAGRNGTSRRHWLEPIAGLELHYGERELILRYRPAAVASGRRDTAERSRVSKGEKRPNIMKKIGSFMMMIPVGLQLLQLPVAIASIKFSLLRSILVAKVAVVLLLLRVLFAPPTSEKVIVVRAPPPPPPPKESHDYHYPYPFEDPEDSRPGWLDYDDQDSL